MNSPIVSLLASLGFAVGLVSFSVFDAQAADEIVSADIEFSRLEPQVAEQLQSVLAILVEVTGKEETTATQRGEAYGEFGRLLHAYGYAAEAAKCYRTAIRYQPEELRWWRLLGSACEMAGRLPDSETALRKALVLQDNPSVRIRLANVLVQQNKRDEARRLYAELIESDPELAAAQAGAGTLALEERDFPKAVQHLSKAIELAPEANRLHYSLAMAYRGIGDVERARKHLRMRGEIGLKPFDPLVDELPQLIRGAQVHLMRGRVAFAAGAYPDSVHEYRLAIEAAPDNVAARVNLAVALTKLARIDEAIEQLKQVLQRSPDHSTALFNLASLQQVGGDHDQAAENLKKLLELQPQDMAARRLLAKSRQELGKLPEAIETLRAGLILKPDHELTVLQLAEVLVQARQYEQAAALLNNHAKNFPSRGLTAHALARFLVSCPEPTFRSAERALPLARSVFNASPTFEHSETLAMALAANQQFEEAIRLQTTLLEAAQKQGIESVAKRVGENLKRYEQRLGAP